MHYLPVVLLSASGGFKLALHHHLDIAVIRQLGINITPGTETQVVLSMGGGKKGFTEFY